ncbi:hypothetical protein K0B96_06490 [Horticoccus luteus]|uniref:Uncharacterized protein n=1 Tax=Horticoccus luteus TaxID=2862869 RepID=A0A8F9XHH7_9BACT|nr:hypothetical protein [Horticoccus luteus]QYM80257.1 hypothetical protein K0B96_06490 [Horticoccus luteus]
MKHYPATRGPAPLSGLTHTTRRQVGVRLHHRCSVWFVLGFFSAATLAGYVAGLLP